MVVAFIMVETTAGKSTGLRDHITELDAVLEAHIVAGEYDIVVEAEGDQIYTVLDTVSTELRDLEGIVDTRTYICLE